MAQSSRSSRFTPLPAFLLLVLVPGFVPAQLGPTGTQFWTQASPGTGASLATDAETGRALAIGDFDCNGIEDLAIGMPGDTVGGLAGAGSVLVLYGTHAGPGTTAPDLLTQDTPGVEDAAETDDRFGEALAAGDFDDDGCDDLAIGAPQKSLKAPAIVSAAGAVHVLYGSVLGLTVAGDELFTQDTAGVGGVAQAGDHFAATLLAADLDLDGDAELVVGAPDEDLEGGTPVTDAGAVHVFLGSLGGLGGGASLLFVPGDAVLNYVPGDFDHCGAALAAGELAFGGGVELAIGVPGRAGSLPGDLAAGEVEVVSNVMGVLTGDAYSFTVRQGLNSPGVREAFDRFGAALAAADFRGDGYDDLVVGAPGEDLEAVPAESAGAVLVIDLAFGGDTNQVWTQEELAPEHADPFDRFGASLAIGDFDGNGFPDLAIGAPGESLGALDEAGIVHLILNAAGNGLSAAGRQQWLQTLDPSDAGDEFGAALAAGRLSGHTGEDLAIGVPREDLGAFADAGGVNTLFSIVLFVDGFAGGDSSAWSAAVP